MEIFKINFLIKRNIKLYFKDKLTFFLSLLTPLILVFLFLTFLRGTYESSLLDITKGFDIDKGLINSFTGGWLFSSIMATSTITVTFCSNMMVDDKLKHITPGFSIAPIKKSTLQFSYTISNFITSLLVCSVLLVISFIYLAIVGWALSFVDVLLIIIDMILSIMFGTLIISIISLFVSSQGAFGAICTLVSSMYGFLCGAYMPLSVMGKGIQGFVSFNPGTYATVIFRRHYMGGVLDKLGKSLPSEMVSEVERSFDGSFSFFGHDVPEWSMYLILILTVAALAGIYILLTNFRGKHKMKMKINNKH